MHIKAVVGGPLSTVGYLVFDRVGGSAAIIDTPLGSTKRFLALLEAQQLKLQYVINTHGHWDQIADNAPLLKATGASLCAHSWDSARMSDPRLTMEPGRELAIVPSFANRSLHDKDVVEVGEIELEVWHTPGHSPGSICLLRDDTALFSGDTLLRMGVGKTDIPGGNADHLSASLRRISSLPDNVLVYPSHGIPTIIRDERWLLQLAAAEAS